MPTLDPKRLKRWLILIAVLYLLMPRDLIFDYAGRGLGFIDDLGLIGLLTYFFRTRALRYMAGQGAQRDGAGAEGRGHQTGRASGERNGGSQGPTHDAVAADSEPHAVLGVEAGASHEEIRAAYRARMREYHPDKVAHLGEDLRKLAHRKSLEIQQAYERLRG